MIIGINAAAAAKQPRTGVEEYVYQLIKEMTMLGETEKHRLILFSPQKTSFDFDLPPHFEAKKLNWPLPMWTQFRLAGEMLAKKPEVLFIPVHILPLAHPQKSVVTVHGLEYEYFPKMYPKRHLAYLRWSAKRAVKYAEKIIAVSENTKKDLVKFCGADPEKIAVVYHGAAAPKIAPAAADAKAEKPYFLFIGRLEEKKNISGLAQGFDLFKKKYRSPHQLVLAGPAGYGYQKIKSDFGRLKFRKEIIELGYVGEEEKWRLYQSAEALVFPSLYEGFGLPVLEAQASGCPVITSDVSSMPEVAGQGAILIRPEVEQICQAMYKIIDDAELKKRLILAGRQNAKKFSWQKCARQTFKELTN